MYPNAQLRGILEVQLSLCALVYNALLEEINAADYEGRPIAQGDTQKLILKLKKENQHLNAIYSKALQMVNNMLWYNLRSMQGLRRKGRKAVRLRFKTGGSFRAINYNQSGFSIDRKGKKITFSKIGTINVKLNREMRGEVKGVIIKKQACNWFALVQVEEDFAPLPMTGKNVGIDMGINNLIADSNGNLIENPNFLQKALPRIRMMQKNLSRKNKGSKNYEKERKRLERRHANVSNRRRDFLHKVSRFYVNNFDTISIEDLDCKGMIGMGRSRTLHRSISNAAWRMCRDMLSYKAQRAGRRLILVDPKDTSQRCSRCGKVKEEKERLRLHDRIYKCKNCGFEADRDYNAAVNIIRSGQGLPVVPSEVLPLPRVIKYTDMNSGHALSMNKETHAFGRG